MDSFRYFVGSVRKLGPINLHRLFLKGPRWVENSKWRNASKKRSAKNWKLWVYSQLTMSSFPDVPWFLLSSVLTEIFCSEISINDLTGRTHVYQTFTSDRSLLKDWFNKICVENYDALIWCTKSLQNFTFFLFHRILEKRLLYRFLTVSTRSGITVYGWVEHYLVEVYVTDNKNFNPLHVSVDVSFGLYT